jgi:uncharacterized damage-inducible protein DinB
MKTLQMMFEHMRWADHRMLQAIKNSQPENPKAVQLFAHMLQAEQVWLTRLQGKNSSSLPIWPEAALMAVPSWLN